MSFEKASWEACNLADVSKELFEILYEISNNGREDLKSRLQGKLISIERSLRLIKVEIDGR